MPKKKNPESQAEQSARFRAEVARLIDAGELNPIEADKALDGLLANEAGRLQHRVRGES